MYKEQDRLDCKDSEQQAASCTPKAGILILHDFGLCNWLFFFLFSFVLAVLWFCQAVPFLAPSLRIRLFRSYKSLTMHLSGRRVLSAKAGIKAQQPKMWLVLLSGWN